MKTRKQFILSCMLLAGVIGFSDVSYGETQVNQDVQTVAFHNGKHGKKHKKKKSKSKGHHCEAYYG